MKWDGSPITSARNRISFLIDGLSARKAHEDIRATSSRSSDCGVCSSDFVEEPFESSGRTKPRGASTWIRLGHGSGREAFRRSDVYDCGPSHS